MPARLLLFRNYAIIGTRILCQLDLYRFGTDRVWESEFCAGKTYFFSDQLENENPNFLSTITIISGLPKIEKKNFVPPRLILFRNYSIMRTRIWCHIDLEHFLTDRIWVSEMCAA